MFERLRPWFGPAAVGIGLVAAAGLLLFTEVEWGELRAALGRLPVVPLLLLMVVLPPFGFSISIVYLLAGARFGPVWGGVVVAGVTAAHLLVMHLIGRHLLRGPLERLFRRRRHHLPQVPEGENASLSVMAVLAPGLPYFSRNYLLALAGVPLAVYFWICLPLYVARSYVTLFLGDLTRTPEPGKLALLVAIWVLKLGICGSILVRFRRRWRRQRGAAHRDVVGEQAR